MFANSKKQPLSEHSIAVALISLKLFEELKIEESTMLKKTIDNIENYKREIFFAGLLHDIGKADENFQDFIRNKSVSDSNEPYEDGVHLTVKKKKDEGFSFLNYPRHNEISWAISEYLNLSQTTKYVIYFHHAAIVRPPENVFDSAKILERVLIKNKNFEENIKSFLKECSNYSSLFKEYENDFNKFLEIKLQKEERISTTPYFLYQNKNIDYYPIENRESIDQEEIKKLLARSLIVSADRIVSSLSAEKLKDILDNFEIYKSINSISLDENDDLVISVNKMIENFQSKNEKDPTNRKRDESQDLVAKKLAYKDGVATLFGPAGCGKTKIFLQWYKEKTEKNKKAKKLFIITPRKMICSALFDELRSDYVPEAKIELLTGEVKKFWDGNNVIDIDDNHNLDSNITITTIDQLISVMLSHKKIDMLLEFMHSYVVFDEFHELFNIEGIVLIFKLFIKLKMMLQQPNVLLVSATPNYYFLENVLGLKDSVEYIETFNNQSYEFENSIYEIDKNEKNQLEKSELYQRQSDGSIVIFNTAKQSQLSTIAVNKEKVINFHSKFTPNDRNEIYKKIIKNWKHKRPITDSILRSGPIVQASLNISTMNLVTQLCSAENWLQRIGRANRFGVDGMAKVITVFSSLSKNKIATNNQEAKFLEKISAKEQTFEWLDFFSKNMNEENKCVLTLSEIYNQYREFHSLDKTKEAYAKDFEKIIEKSLKNFIKNDFTPKEFIKVKTKSKNNKLSSKSIRGKSLYVLPVTYEIFSKKIGDWLYLPDENNDSKNLLTLSEDELINYENIFTAQKIVLSLGGLSQFSNSTYSKSNYHKKNNNAIKAEARDSTAPILLSYVEDIPNAKENYNKNGFFYVSKGDIKIGLLNLNI